jgi:pimeloyl-ACP methyl ester carboxylesterase
VLGWDLRMDRPSGRVVAVGDNVLEREPVVVAEAKRPRARFGRVAVATEAVVPNSSARSEATPTWFEFRDAAPGRAGAGMVHLIQVPPILAPQDGFLFLDREKFAASFAADVTAREAALMADSQVPWGAEALNGANSEPAWRSKPSWYLVATDDRMIPPPARRTMAERAGSTVAEEAGSHSIYISQPHAVAVLIEQAARLARPAAATLR